MTITSKTFGAIFAALLISGLMSGPVGAAQNKRVSDINAITHGSIDQQSNKTRQFGRLPGFYKWSDKASISQRRIGSELKPIGEYSPKAYKWSDIEAVTHN